MSAFRFAETYLLNNLLILFYLKLIKEQLFHRQQKLDILPVGMAYFTVVCEEPFAFGCFFGENVALESMFALDLTCSGQSESFLCTRICLHFWHFFLSEYIYIYNKTTSSLKLLLLFR